MTLLLLSLVISLWSLGYSWVNTIYFHSWENFFGYELFRRKGPSSKAMVLSVVMYGCESWTIKKAECRRIDAFELWCWKRLLRVPWTARRSNLAIHPKGNQSWIFIRRTDAKAETPILWPPDGKNRLIGKDPDAGKDWRKEEKRTADDEMVRWHHRCYGHEFE